MRRLKVKSKKTKNKKKQST